MTPIELCIANIRGDFPQNAIGYQSVEDALLELQKRTGMDFGLDAAKWQAWLDNNPELVHTKVSTVRDVRDARKAANLMKPKLPPALNDPS